MVNITANGYTLSDQIGLETNCVVSEAKGQVPKPIPCRTIKFVDVETNV